MEFLPQASSADRLHTAVGTLAVLLSTINPVMAQQVADAAAIGLDQVAIVDTDCSFFVDQDHVAASDANAGITSNFPFLTIQAAANVAVGVVGSNVVCVKPSTTAYTEQYQGTPDKKFKAVKPRNSGTPATRIIFTNYPSSGKKVLIDQQFDFTPGRDENGALQAVPNALMGFLIIAEDYITIHGFEIRNATAGVRTTKIDQVASGVYDPPTGIIVDSCQIHDIRALTSQGNTGAIQPNDCYDCTISRNVLRDVAWYSSTATPDNIVIKDNFNIAGIHSFGMLNTEIVGNRISRAGAGIHYKSWTTQPRNQPGSVNDFGYAPTTNVPPPVTALDKGMIVHRNQIFDIATHGIFIEPSGGSGRQLSGGVINENPAYHNIEIFENVFFSTEDATAYFDNNRARMSLALNTSVRGAAEQSSGLKFFNNTVLAFNGVNIDAFQNVEIYNNFFSLATAPTGTGPKVAIRTHFQPGQSAGERLTAGRELNLGTVDASVTVTGAGNCNAVVDPALLVPPFVSTPPFDSGGGVPDAQFFCSDNVQWTADLVYVDDNFYHDAESLQLNRFGDGGVTTGGNNIETLISLAGNVGNFANWQALDATQFSLSYPNPDGNSTGPLSTPDSGFLNRVIFGANGAILLDNNSPVTGAPNTELMFHSPALEGIGRFGDNIGAYRNAIYDPASGIPLDPATQSTLPGPPIPLPPSAASQTN
ncbi:MAG: hypothetical protein P1U54_10880 [Immundisolibacteraceae bacterium]|nr:hypothetical protein [Immundisolibacteraceae bacterium]